MLQGKSTDPFFADPKTLKRLLHCKKNFKVVYHLQYVLIEYLGDCELRSPGFLRFGTVFKVDRKQKPHEAVRPSRHVYRMRRNAFTELLGAKIALLGAR